MTVKDLTLALWQTHHPATTAEALQRMDVSAAQARAQGAELLITPEMYLTGYAIGADRVAALAEPVDGPLAQAVASIAQRHGIAIVYGYTEHNPSGKPFNAAQAIDADGARLTNTRKTHLFGDADRAMFSAGEQAPAVFEFNGWKLGLLICYDLEFPENARRLAAAGAELILVPTANMVPYGFIAEVTVRSRAFENQCYVAYANYCGKEMDFEYCGLSSIAGADGQQIAKAGRDEALIVGTLDKATLASARSAFTYLNDRRPDLY